MRHLPVALTVSGALLISAPMVAGEYIVNIHF